MKKTVIVKKCRSHRIGITVFCVAIFVALTVCVLAMRTPAALLLYVPFLVIAVPAALYFLTWQIRFGEKEVCRRVFFRDSKPYSYAMLREVVKNYYVSERNVTVRMHFTDGKTLQLRMDDENAATAIKVLQKHCSFKTL